MPLNSLTTIFYWHNKVWKEGSDPAFQFLFHNNLASQTSVSSILEIIFFPVPHPMSRFWRILLPQDKWNPMSHQDILHFPKPTLYFRQISDFKTTLQEPDTSQTALRGRKPSGPASHLTCGEVFIMITFIAVLAKIGHCVHAPVTIKPQGRGGRAYPGWVDISAYFHVKFNFLHKGGNTEAKYLFLGGKFCFV